MVFASVSAYSLLFELLSPLASVIDSNLEEVADSFLSKKVFFKDVYHNNRKQTRTMLSRNIDNRPLMLFPVLEEKLLTFPHSPQCGLCAVYTNFSMLTYHLSVFNLLFF